MGNFRVPDLAELLYATLLDLEAREGFRADDPACIEFRRNVLRIIADLDTEKSRPPKCA
jgi:hypothetical protein